MQIINKIKKILKIGVLPYQIKPPYTHVVQIGDPILRNTAKEVNPETIKKPEFQKLMKILTSMLMKDDLAGVSAPQVGIPLRVIAIQCSNLLLQTYYSRREIESQLIQELPPQVWINPIVRVLDYSTNINFETCSSVLSFQADVKRYNRVSISGLDAEGNKKMMEGSGLIARIIQHEIDHLNGILYTDKMIPKSLTCTVWREINELNGLIELRYYPRVRV